MSRDSFLYLITGILIGAACVAIGCLIQSLMMDMESLTLAEMPGRTHDTQSRKPLVVVFKKDEPGETQEVGEVSEQESGCEKRTAD